MSLTTAQLAIARAFVSRSQRMVEGWAMNRTGIMAAKYASSNSEGWTYCFNTNEEALAYVHEQAEQGSEPHRDLLVYLVSVRMKVEA